ncbi:hypothetical protein VTN77DRAFT_4031 [Rasamsonia byssochlamydoides]|uniref:uncharacterized protein n=1 Tax=Rasamsonia byssochlamydoides TaxID=89139 RepID=UPI003743525F
MEQDAFIVECTYSGAEFLASITLTDRLSPIQINGIVNQGPAIDSSVKWLLSNMTHDYLHGWSQGAGGGSLADGWISSGFNSDGENNTVSTELLGTILSETSEAYFSLLRQNVEIANQYRDASQLGDNNDNGSSVTLSISVLKLGGGGYGWLAVYAVLLIGALMGVVRTIAEKNVAQWEAQDPIELLQKGLGLDCAGMNETTRVKFADNVFEVLDRTPSENGRNSNSNSNNGHVTVGEVKTSEQSGLLSQS